MMNRLSSAIRLLLALAAVAVPTGAGVPAGAQDARATRGHRGRPVRYEPFGVEVLVKGVPLEQYPARGRHYIEALEGEEYTIRITNPLPVRVAVALSVDGLNTIDARRSSARDASKWVVGPYGTITVTGWQVSSQRARRFYFTTERDSYAARLGRAEDLGLVSAVFFRERADYSEVTPRPRPYPLGTAREKGESGGETSQRQSAPPSARNETRAQSSTAGRDAARPDDSSAATGMGRSVGHDVRWVQLDLEQQPSAEVTLRYEYRPALVRLGILPRPYNARDALRRRERARGFEDGRYSPEP